MSKTYIKKLYNKYAADYHTKRQSKKSNFYNYFIDVPAMTGLIKPSAFNKIVLDMGCGTGIFTKEIKGWCAKVIGIDNSEAMISIAKSENPGIEFHVRDAEDTKFGNKKFDIVISSLMIHYFKNLSPLFSEVNRILKIKGQFIFSFHHPIAEVLEKTEINGKNKNIINDYFSMKEYKWKMFGKKIWLSYHHTFEYVSEKLNENGFLIEIIKEPQPIEEGKNVNEDDYNYLIKFPSFCIIQAIKN